MKKIKIIKILNILLFKWFFIRLTKNIENRVQDITVFSYDIVSDTNISSRSKGNTYKYIWYSFQYFVVPCTGWYNNMIYLTKYPKYLNLTKPKLI